MTPLERAARAIHAKSREMGGNFAQWDFDDPERAKMREAYIDLVAAVLQAIREPSEAMIDRFVSRALCVSVHGEGGWSNYAREQWKTMIDAALSE